MISASHETIELCKQLEPSFWTLAKPYLAESIVSILVFVILIFLVVFFAFLTAFFGER